MRKLKSFFIFVLVRLHRYGVTKFKYSGPEKCRLFKVLTLSVQFVCHRL